MQITFVGPAPAHFFDQGVERLVSPGDTVDVHPDTAGRPPAARLAAAMAELRAAVAAIDHERASQLREELVDLDHGAGLLAQPDNWVPAQTKTKTSPKDGE